MVCGVNGGCIYKCSKYILILFTILAISGSLLFNLHNDLKCEGEWDDTKEVNITRNGKGFCEWRIELDWVFSPQPVYSLIIAKYEGEWKNNKREGFGTFTAMSGNKYEGEWKNDVRDGSGVFTFNDGSYLSGFWFKDTLNCSAGMLHISPNKIEDITAVYQGHLINSLMSGSGNLHLSNFLISCIFADGHLSCGNGFLFVKENDIVDSQIKMKYIREFEIRHWKNEFQYFVYYSDIEIFSPNTTATYKVFGNDVEPFRVYLENGAEVDMHNKSKNSMITNFSDIEDEYQMLSQLRRYVQTFEIYYQTKHMQVISTIYDFGNSEKEEAMKKELFLQKESEKDSKTDNKSTDEKNNFDDNTFLENTENPFEEVLKELQEKHLHNEL